MNLLLSIGKFFSIAILVAMAQFIVGKWMIIRLEKSIQYEYDKQLENHRFQQLQKQKAEVVGKFFARWIKYRGQEERILDKRELVDYYEDLNRMSIEISLWINDENLLSDIMSRLQNSNNAKTIREIVVDVRKLVLEKDDKFDPNKITVWPTGEKVKRLFDIQD